MSIKGKARTTKTKDDINTDYIISGRYKFKIQDPYELAKHVMEDLDPDFYRRIEKGDFLVAGRNFGCGSSREQAPQAIKYSGLQAVIAKSFARIFYRNCFNLGLLAIECNTDEIDENDELEIDLNNGLIKNSTKNKEIKIAPLPKTMQTLLQDGGLIEHFKKHGGFKIT
ncbi:3-isopropylmalate dehydratase [candidate division WOR-1 bacterium RIFOXYA2_FULL_36_21]|uniref:3-isopropylmalate dehydratase small subunit n=1 Tax=candidate division WOR-1 bacterium RIFOXYB2_FULL_36_35 TaxID=1802578 RepID=A0A1F4S3I0_UNCSA|nr:MAG: 3-isopropylmalate dehydratase [candidate division WOR-1 bacterium RIFOXYA2_FULL_36_21]OGC14988.1 MAG: 3-isopropylmalate dehydratase [candidate division WOR-1 bacterium RIFOXYB2_FULL_36_35]OGC18695.1 MAG: 3-isopropylmalate dehydratase [candidate division WOR-1 bacterium RIFOXYA12_FULL_36_13]